MSKVPIECANCKDVFYRWPSQLRQGIKYCSPSCRREAQNVVFNCFWCAKKVRRARSLVLEKQNKFCSKECHDSYQVRNRIAFECELCGSSFSLSKSTIRQREEQGAKVRFCSSDCAKSACRYENHPKYKEGHSLAPDGACIIYFPESPSHCNHLRAHRVVAENVLGRRLEHHEHILHVDRNKRNNTPSNLYVCESISECQLILSGGLEYPVEGNLLALAQEFRNISEKK